MKIEVIRPQSCGETCTIGEMYVDGVFECFTLEDVVRPSGEKVYGETAIPAGCYRVTITHSNRFGRDMPLVNDVPSFSGVRIHTGNVAANTEGCILVGRTKGADFIGESKLAFEPLFKKIGDAIQHGEEVWLEVK